MVLVVELVDFKANLAQLSADSFRGAGPSIALTTKLQPNAMTTLIKKSIHLFFRMLDSLFPRGQSWLLTSVYSLLSDKEKIVLSRLVLLDLSTAWDNDKKFKLGTFVNALGFKSPLADRFATKLINGLDLFKSQLGQDCIVDLLHHEKTGGIFVEIGVGDGTKLSNSHFLEKHRNWSGILCEPAIRFHESITRDRGALLVTEAVYNESGLSLAFSEVVGSEELSGLSIQTAKVGDVNDRPLVREYEVRTISFNDIYKSNLAGRTIDYLSVDTEGTELTILKSIDFDAIEISVISAEHNYDAEKLDEISSFLGQRGYVQILTGVFEFDAVFAKNDLVRECLRKLG